MDTHPQPGCVRRFSAEYLEHTRAGMWADSRAALADLSLASRRRVFDVGCGTGELTAVLAEEAPDAEVVGVDADPTLLSVAADGAPVVAGDALALPFADDAADLVVCQALLVNLPSPAEAVGEFARVSSELVAAIEPDNGAVEVDSSVAAEAAVEGRARRAYLDGLGTDGTLGGEGSRSAFEAADLSDVRTRRYVHERVVEPPYDQAELADARRKATGAGLDDGRATLLAGAMDEDGYADLRADWRAMGRTVIDQMRAGEYRRVETVPFYVTTGRVSGEPGE
jgi:SAM-dependent methyltransferase